MTNSVTIAVGYASVGSGHRIAAEAIATEIESRSGSGVHAELVDALAFASRGISGDWLSTTFVGPTSGLYDAVWGSAAAGAFGRALARPLLPPFFPGFAEHLRSMGATSLVSTHAMSALLGVHVKRRMLPELTLVDVATDFGLHGFWPREGVDLTCVADEPCKETLLGRGYAPERVVVTGIPVRRQFSIEYDCDAARKHFGLPPEGRIVLALAGSKMAGPYERLKESLAVSLPALASLPNTAVAVVCGNDEIYAEEMRTRAAGFGTTNVQVLGFIDHMAPLMACADLAIAKPGGVVSAECLAAGVPLVLVGPAAGQERYNARALTQAGAASFASDPRLLAEYVRKVVSKPVRLAKMREAAAAHAKPAAAHDVVDRVMELVDAD